MPRKPKRWKLWRAFWRHPVLGSVITATAVIVAALLAPSQQAPPSDPGIDAAPGVVEPVSPPLSPTRPPTPSVNIPRRLGRTLGDDSRDCIPAAECCRICKKGKACGDSCINALLDCHVGDGCACDDWEVCPS